MQFRDYSIRTKLTVAIVTTSVITLALACLAFTINDRNSFMDRLTQNVSLMASVMADNCRSAIAFDDDATAGEILATISSDKHVVWCSKSAPWFALGYASLGPDPQIGVSSNLLINNTIYDQPPV